MVRKADVPKKEVASKVDNVADEMAITHEDIINISKQITGLCDGIIKIGIELEKQTIVLKQIRDGQSYQEPK